MDRMRIIVTGDRNWHCRDLAAAVMARLVVRYGPEIVIVHGDAPGVDRAFREACEEQGVDHEPHPADWDRLGKAAGPIRNGEMVKAGAAMAIAVHRMLCKSKGTRDCANKCIMAHIPTYLIDSLDPCPTRLNEPVDPC